MVGYELEPGDGKLHLWNEAGLPPVSILPERLDGSKHRRQPVRGSVYSIIASGITLVLGLTRSIGLDIALIHRQEVDQDFLRTYFSLYVGLDLAGAGLLLAAIPLLQRIYPQTPQFEGVLGLLVVALFCVKSIPIL